MTGTEQVTIGETAWQQAINALSIAWPPALWSDVTVLLAVSGGRDSMLLAEVVRAIRGPSTGRVVVAHYQHGIREDAERDAEFVRAWAATAGWQCRVGYRRATNKSAPEPAGRLGTDEGSMRRDRLAFLTATAKQSGARYVALAHHRDDQCETVLHQLLRGTGIAGAAGMSQVRHLHADCLLVRPLLTVPGATIAQAAFERGIVWREDASNQSLKPRRNWMRKRLLPLIRQRYPHADQSIARFANHARQLHFQIEQAAELLASTSVRATEVGGIRLEGSLRNEPLGVLVALLRQQWLHRGWSWQSVDQRHLHQLVQMLQAGRPNHWNLPDRLAARCIAGAVLIEPQNDRPTA